MFIKAVNQLYSEKDEMIANTKQIKHKQAQAELLKGFIAALENSGEITNVFDEGVWSSLMDHVTINSKEDIRFIFKNGVEIRV